MRGKILCRTRRHKGELILKHLENIETRASSACEELEMAHRFACAIADQDGEVSEDQDAFD